MPSLQEPSTTTSINLIFFTFFILQINNSPFLIEKTILISPLKKKLVELTISLLFVYLIHFVVMIIVKAFTNYFEFMHEALAFNQLCARVTDTVQNYNPIHKMLNYLMLDITLGIVLQGAIQ